MSEPLLLGIDLGAGSLKATVITPAGRVVGVACRGIDVSSPRPGFSEQQPDDWWRAMTAALRELWDTGIDAGRIAALSVTAGAHTHVLEDETGRILRPAIMWNDQRAGGQAERLRESEGKRILTLSGNRVSATWTLPQLLWLREHEPDVHRRIHRIRPAKDWLRRQLDGSDVTDDTDAWGMMLAGADGSGWLETLCALADIRTDQLPSIVSATSLTGTVSRKSARATGLPAGTPVICGTSDTNAETYAAGMTRPGIGVLKLATAGTVSTLTHKPVFSEDVIHYPHLVADHYYAILGTNSCASAHQWLCAALFADIGFAGMDLKAGEAPAGAGGLLFHPYLNGERSPYWDPALRASFVGLGFEHGAPHICRALYEGIAFTLRDCLEVLRRQQPGFSSARLIGGGARSALWRQIIADVTGLTIELPKQGDASFGAALIAGIGSGIFAGTDAAATVIEIAETLAPKPENREIYEINFTRFRETKAALTPVNHSLTGALSEAP